MNYEAFIQFGALGIVAYFVWWLTQKFNGSIKDNTNALKENSDVARDLKEKEEYIVKMLDDRTARFTAIEAALTALQKSNEEGFKLTAAAIEESAKATLDRLWNLVKGEALKEEEDG